MSLVELDDHAERSSKRATIEEVFGLKSVFPTSDLTLRMNNGTRQFEARCMYPRRDKKTDLNDDFIEDVLIRTFSDLNNDRAFQNPKIWAAADLVLQSLSKQGIVFSSARDRTVIHPSISILLSQKIEQNQLYLELSFAKHTVLSVSRFHSSSTLSTGTMANTTGLGCRDVRLRFIVFQLLQATKFLHENGLCFNQLTPNEIMLDDDMWLYAPFGFSGRVLSYLANDKQHPHPRCSSTFIPKPVDFYVPTTIQWLTGKISNYEYLMTINYGAGRTTMDPLYHPILPWVTDFTANCIVADYNNTNTGSEGNSLRDLAMTKFRLSKGDTQLETTFKHSDPPHHVPESISELTYYIYMARRTPMQVLRRVVRDVFVPEHYPQSMHRIYEWTPDECIPEFYSDPTVFLSIHEDVGLHNLELPEFAPTPEEFIKYHRAVLESDAVSEYLHEWIDLTFGYCLQGEAAIKHMNVPLCHTLTSTERLGLDTPNVNKNPGFVMLFDRPHPRREVERKQLGNHVYSYNNASNASESFIALNPQHYVNHASKYHAVSDYLGAMDGLAQEVKEYLRLDHNQRVSVAKGIAPAFLNSTKDPLSTNGANKESVAGSGSSIAVEDRASIVNNQPQARRRKSLTQPPADPTMVRLKQVENITLPKNSAAMQAIDNLATQVQHYKFALRGGCTLDAIYCPEPVAENTIRKSEEEKQQLSQRFSDELFLEVVENVGRALLNAPEPNTFIAEDMFFVGCMIAELFIGRSLLQKNDLLHVYATNQFAKVAAIVYARTTGIPLPIRRLIAVLVHPNPKVRPLAPEILSMCTFPNDDSSELLLSDKGKSKILARKQFIERLLATANNSESQLFRMEMLSDCCELLFPPYFETIYDIIGAIKMASTKGNRLEVLLSKLDAIHVLPLEGVNLALYNLMEVLSDSSYLNNFTSEGKEKEQLISLASRYWMTIDVLGIRLGQEACEKLIIPQVLKFLNNFHNTELMTELVESPLWSVLVLRGGVKAFLRNFLPQLLTYISAGALQSLLEKGKGHGSFSGDGMLNTMSTAPLWSLPEWNSKPHWLRGVPSLQLQNLQQAAATALVSLCEVDSLGKGLTARYIIPSLLSLIGSPQLAVTAFSTVDHPAVSAIAVVTKVEESIQRVVSDESVTSSVLSVQAAALAAAREEESIPKTLDALEAYLIERSSVNAAEMYVVNAIVRSGIKLGEEVSSDLILSTIMSVTLPELEAQMTATPRPGTAAAMLEVIVLLNGILPSLTQPTIVQYLLQPVRPSATSLPRIMSHWPLSNAWSFLDDIEDFALYDGSQLQQHVENIRLFSVLNEFCRLMVSISMIVGADTCAELILPGIDTFFHNFVEAYGMFPVESKMMMKAFELGSELFLPLSQLMSAEAIQTYVPNLNPRLEMWLNAISFSSSTPPRSPPLPSNIWPEQTSEMTNRPERKKSIMSWISGKVSSLTSSSSSNPNNGIAAGPASTVTASSTSSKAAVADSMVVSAKKTRKASNPDIAVEFDSMNSTMATAAKPKSFTELIHNSMTPSGHKQPLYSNNFASPDGTELISLEPDRPWGDLPTATVVSVTSNAKTASESPPQLQSARIVNSEDIRIESPVDESLAGVAVDEGSNSTKVLQQRSEDLSDPGPVDSDDEIDAFSPFTPSSQALLNEETVENAAPVSIDSDLPPLMEGLTTAVAVEEETTAALQESDVLNEDGQPLSIISSTPPSSYREKDDSNPDGSNNSNSNKQQHAQQAVFLTPEKEMQHPFLSYRQLIAGGGGSGRKRGSTYNVPVAPKSTSKTPRRATKVSQLLTGGEQETLEEAESREQRNSAQTWLLGGLGRWNVDREVYDRTHRDHHKLMKGANNHRSVGIYYSSNADWSPAAQMSMTTPKIAVDVAADAGALINFQLQCGSSWKLEETMASPSAGGNHSSAAGGSGGSNPNIPANIRCMVSNPQESLLMTCSRGGVRIFSLSSHPLQQISQYTRHQSVPVHASLLRDGMHALTNDGTIHLWDIETQATMSVIGSADKSHGFSYSAVLPAKLGIHASIDAMGDEQFLATAQDSVCFYDIRCGYGCGSGGIRQLHKVADWTLPVIPPPQGTLYNSSVEPLHLTCAAPHEHYIYAGSSTGGLWVMERRMGRVLHSWQAHDGPILRIHPLNDRHFLAVSDRNAAVWEYSSELPQWQQPPVASCLAPPASYPKHFTDGTASGNGNRELSWANVYRENRDIIGASGGNNSTSNPSGHAGGFHTGLGSVGEFRRSLNIKATSDAPFTAATVLLAGCDALGNNSASCLGTTTAMAGNPSTPGHGLGGIKYGVFERDLQSLSSSRNFHVLYFLAGHRLHSGLLPNLEMLSSTPVGVSKEGDDLKLLQNYFYDRKGTKLSKSKMNVTSALLLPLRKLLLLGTEDGYVRVVS